MKPLRILAAVAFTGVLIWGVVASHAVPATPAADPLDSSASSSNSTAKWLDNFKTASDLAKAQNKSLLLNFTGSDWCPWCIKMDQEVLDTAAFKSYAAQNLVLMTVDFPQHTQLPSTVTDQNASLQQKYNIEGFPTFVLLSPSGQQLKQMVGYQQGGPSAFIDQIKQALAK
jgi:thioredoxin-related protein